jgi:tetratricopeptide (TPR) repeat protein
MEIVEGRDILRKCPNGHPVHDECLKEWLPHSSNCPLCNAPYSEDLLEASKKSVLQKETEKVSIERQNKIRKIAKKMVFLKFEVSIEELIEKKEYDLAIEKLAVYSERNLSDYERNKILFLKGKIYYFKERYDMAISNLFRLVKEKFDYPDAFLYLGKAYQELGLEDKAKWAFERVPK